MSFAKIQGLPKNPSSLEIRRVGWTSPKPNYSRLIPMTNKISHFNEINKSMAFNNNRPKSCPP